jgi:hypothetical protein
MNKFNVWTAAADSLTEASWVQRANIEVPEWHHFKGGNGTLLSYQRTIMRKAKGSAGLSGIRGTTDRDGDDYIFRPYGQRTILFVAYAE